MATGYDAKRQFGKPPSLESVLDKQQLIAFFVLLLILSAMCGLVIGL